MTGYLLDTHIILWSAGATKQLTPAVRTAIEIGPVWLSVIAFWEVCIKVQKRALELEDPWQWWLESLDRLRARPLSLRPDHVATMFELPHLHRDPFDRALIAQALAEDLTLLSVDRTVATYATSGLQIIG